MRHRIPFLALFSLFLATSPVIGAQEPLAPVPSSESGEETEAERARANELAVFLGGTSESGETFFTIGAEYERRIGPLFGASVVVEHVSDLDAWVFLAPLSFRPLRCLGLKVYAGPGLESKVALQTEELGGQRPVRRPALATTEPGERETFFTFRTGVAWALEWKRLTFTPQLEFDFTRENEHWEHAVVFGMAIGFGF